MNHPNFFIVLNDGYLAKCILKKGLNDFLSVLNWTPNSYVTLLTVAGSRTEGWSQYLTRHIQRARMATCEVLSLAPITSKVAKPARTLLWTPPPNRRYLLHPRDQLLVSYCTMIQKQNLVLTLLDH